MTWLFYEFSSWITYTFQQKRCKMFNSKFLFCSCRRTWRKKEIRAYNCEHHTRKLKDYQKMGPFPPNLLEWLNFWVSSGLPWLTAVSLFLSTNAIIDWYYRKFCAVFSTTEWRKSPSIAKKVCFIFNLIDFFYILDQK